MSKGDVVPQRAVPSPSNSRHAYLPVADKSPPFAEEYQYARDKLTIVLATDSGLDKIQHFSATDQNMSQPTHRDS
jgi:hypothetical protein